jgi:virulence-associated protein VagC
VAETRTAKLFKHGRSQAVRLPKEFRMAGTEVRVRRIGRGVLLEPIEHDFAEVAAIPRGAPRWNTLLAALRPARTHFSFSAAARMG